MKTQTPNPFTRNDIKTKKMRQWALQVKANFESQAINKDVDWFGLAQVLCMEYDPMHKKVGMPQASQLTMKVNIGSVVKIASGPKGQKRK
jgi:hypothetical protein